MMNRVLRLGDRTAESLMTPRTRIAWLDAAADFEENLATMRETPFSRYPVYRGSDSDVLGVLEVKIAARPPRRDEHRTCSATCAPPLFVSESTHALKLLEIFREEQQSLALVVDEYGDIQGMVTVNDLMGAVLGRMQSTRDRRSRATVAGGRARRRLAAGRRLAADRGPARAARRRPPAGRGRARLPHRRRHGDRALRPHPARRRALRLGRLAHRSGRPRRPAHRQAAAATHAERGTPMADDTERR